jgi:predicted DCC family thiol-disulfide oxidoreductase YuxK
MTSNDKKLLVFYDGTCPFCTFSATRLLKFDWFKKLKILDMYSNGVLEKFDIPLEDAVQRIQILNGRGKRKQGMRAILEISLNLPILWIFIPLFWLIIQIGLGERIYDWIAKNRFLFPVPGYCPIPDQENDE